MSSGVRLAKEAPARCLWRPWRRPCSILDGGRGDVDEGPRPNSRSIGVYGHGPDRSGAHGPRRSLGRHVAAVGGFPAGMHLIAPQRQPLPIETAIADLRGHGATEMAAGTAGGAGSATNPAPTGLGLGRRTVWASPKLHGLMVAATGAPVDSGWRGSTVGGASTRRVPVDAAVACRRGGPSGSIPRPVLGVVPGHVVDTGCHPPARPHNRARGLLKSPVGVPEPETPEIHA